MTTNDHKPSPKSAFQPLKVCADVGSVVRKNFGWWASKKHQGNTPSGLVELIANALNKNQPVALGFECPLFVPLVKDEYSLTKARQGEDDRRGAQALAVDRWPPDSYKSCGSSGKSGAN